MVLQKVNAFRYWNYAVQAPGGRQMVMNFCKLILWNKILAWKIILKSGTWQTVTTVITCSDSLSVAYLKQLKFKKSFNSGWILQFKTPAIETI